MPIVEDITTVPSWMNWTGKWGDSGCASVRAVIWAVTFVIGAIIGLVVGRWWALLAALAVFVWIYTETGVDEVPHWALALMYAGITAAGIAAGVLGRAAFGRSGQRGTNR